MAGGNSGDRSPEDQYIEDQYMKSARGALIPDQMEVPGLKLKCYRDGVIPWLEKHHLGLDDVGDTPDLNIRVEGKVLGAVLGYTGEHGKRWYEKRVKVETALQFVVMAREYVESMSENKKPGKKS